MHERYINTDNHDSVMSKKKAHRKEKPFWETGRGRFWIGSYLVMVVLAFMVPLDVLDRYPQAKEFTDFMASWNVQVRRVAEFKDEFGQANRFVFSVLWSVMPIYWFLFYLHAIHTANQKITLIRDSWWHYFGTLLICAIGLWGCLGVPGLTARTRGGVTVMGDIARSVIAPGAVFVAGLLTLFIAFAVLAGLSGRVVIRGGKNGG